MFTAVVLIACVVLVVFVRQRKQAGQQQTQGSQQAVTQNDNGNSPEVNAQLQALDEIRKQQGKDATNTQPQTDEEKQAVVQTQLQQLDTIRKAAKVTPPTQQQIDDQLKQLDALRAAAQ